MFLPPGIEAGHAWCLLWLAIAAALLAVVKEPGGDDGVTAEVRKRTYRRLLRLNQYLVNLVETRWLGSDLVPDIDALLDLRSEVQRAASVHQADRMRRLLIRMFRLVLGLEIVAALIFAGLVTISTSDSDLNIPAALAFGTGTIVAAACLLLADLKAAQVEHGQDFE